MQRIQWIVSSWIESFHEQRPVQRESTESLLTVHPHAAYDSPADEMRSVTQKKGNSLGKAQQGIRL